MTGNQREAALKIIEAGLMSHRLGLAMTLDEQASMTLESEVFSEGVEVFMDHRGRITALVANSIDHHEFNHPARLSRNHLLRRTLAGLGFEEANAS